MIRSSYWGMAQDSEVWEALAARFNAKQKRIRVKLEHITGQNYHPKMIAMYMGRCAPDAICCDDEQFRQIADHGVYEDLNPYLRRDIGVRPSDYFGRFWEPWNVDGRQLGIPYIGHCLLIYYNRDQRRAAGVSPDPNPNWTWDEFVRDAKALTRDVDGDGRIDQYGFQRLTWYYCVQWIWGAGGGEMDPGMTHFLFDTPEAKRGFQFHYDHIHKYRICPGVADLPNMTSESMFLTGKVSTIAAGTWWLTQARLAKKFDWDVAPMPIGPVRRATRATSESLAISSISNHKAEAWDWIKFVVGEEGQSIFARFGRGIPARRSVAMRTLPDPRTPQHEERFLEAMDHYAQTACQHKHWMETDTVFTREWDRVCAGQIDIDQFVRIVQPEADKLVRGDEL